MLRTPIRGRSVAAFRIHCLRVEGFKAFTTPQSFDFGGHVFVFGRNGLGKSSVVEAVRWCLFGLADRPEAEVRNVFYPAGECSVELELEGPGGRWRIQRRLRPGSNDSRLTVRDPGGTTVRLAEVFPHIARLGPRDGTHIIFASQHSVRRRPQADITEFDKVLYSYLQIEDVPDLLNALNGELEEQAEIERQRAKEINDAETSLRTRIESLGRRIELVSIAPPWPGETVPTNAETDVRIRGFVEECGGNLESSDGTTETREGLLREAERAIQQKSVTADTARRRSTEAERALQLLETAKEELDDLTGELQTAEARVVSRKEDLKNVLGDKAKEQWLKERDELARQGDQKKRSLELAQQAAGYFEDFSPERCPVCDTGVDPAEVTSRLWSRPAAHPSGAKLPTDLETAQARLEDIDAAETALGSARKTRADATSRTAGARQQLEKLLDDPADLSSYDRTVSRLKEQVQLLKRELEESGTLVVNRKHTLESLRQEARFQEFLSRREVLRRNLGPGLDPAREALGQFVVLLENLRAVRDALQDSFNNTLNGTLPRINAEMTEVFGRLTQQPSFPDVVVEPGPLDATRAVRVRVTSDRAHGELFEPAEVLNGQAFNALNLVPYFVFSQFQAEALELDCLLIDDPSQSFDTSRVDLLMRELATAASHAQLVVASHEEERFARFIGKYFDPGSYRILRVTSFDPRIGPAVECVD